MLPPDACPPSQSTPTLFDQRLQEQREHDLTMQVFAVSAAMVGVCLTAIGILQVVSAQKQAQTLGDDLLALDALLFVSCCALAFWSFKTHDLRLRQRLRWVVDILFLVGLFAMAGICAVIAYSIF